VRSDVTGWALVWRAAVAVVGLVVTVVVAFGAFPVAVWVGWKVASGGWGWPSSVGQVAVWRMLAGIVAGGLVFRFGLVFRGQLVRAWREVTAERGGPGRS
jgi:hypothetical protein